MKQYRLNRLFNAASGRCLDVAVDHGFFGEAAFIAGIEDIGRAVDVLVDANPDAIQLAVGSAPLLQRKPGRDKPALVLRTDIANVYGSRPVGLVFSQILADAVEQAVRLDAACVVANLLEVPDHPELRRDCIAGLMELKVRCDDAAMPLMIEPLVMRWDDAGRGGYGVNPDLQRILGVVRQAAELGADVIKADPCADLDDYHRVVEVARVPVLVRGGGRVPDREILQRTSKVIEQGAAGIVYGRNIIQHADPGAMTRALMSVVHGEAGVEQALAGLGEVAAHG
jgi:class I fructose-bisphosphate aldolase